jgi:hypothetical protein
LRARHNHSLQDIEAKESSKAESIVQRKAPEPLVPEPLSIFRSFETVHPSFDELFERFLRNFTGIGIPKAERVAALIWRSSFLQMKLLKVAWHLSGYLLFIHVLYAVVPGSIGSFPVAIVGARP